MCVLREQKIEQERTRQKRVHESRFQHIPFCIFVEGKDEEINTNTKGRGKGEGWELRQGDGD